jgi:hypothetical protein
MAFDDRVQEMEKLAKEGTCNLIDSSAPPIHSVTGQQEEKAKSTCHTKTEQK